MLTVALPVSMGVFVQFIVVFIDNYFVAKLDGNAMSAASFVGLIYVTLAMIGVGLGNAVQILVARRKGEGRFQDAGSVVGNAFWMALIVAAAQFFLLWVILPIVIQSTIDSPVVAAYMDDFIQYRAWGFLFYTPTLVLNSFWAGIAKTRIMIATTMITATVTIVLDYGLVFGHLGLPNMGMAGAALATTIAECCAFLFMLFYTTMKSNASLSDRDSRFDIGANITRYPTRDTGLLIRLGGPISLQLLSSLGIWVIFYEFVESMGERELQSSFIVRNMYMLVYVSVGGFSTTIKTYVSGLIAEGRQQELVSVMRKLILMNMCGVLVLSHGLWLYPHWIASMFTTDVQVISQTIDSMHIVLPAMFTFSITSMFLGTVEGSGNTLAGFIIEMLAILLYIAAAWLMVYKWHWPIHLVWTSDYVYFIFLGLFSLFYLWDGKWKWKTI
ncbi:MAG: MATE family efflux transporter [Flavobacteriales bacterium]|nr:MATE family efflux transporter [Flavobacteriales bacterium]